MSGSNELLAAVIGAALGALATYLLDVRKERQERRARQREAALERTRLRASIATALVQDLRALEPVLRQFAATPKPALWIGERPPLSFESLRGEVRHLSADRLPAVHEFFRLADNLFATLAEAPGAQRADPTFNHFLRSSAIFALQALLPAKEALVAEGGRVPEPRLVRTVSYPNLPELPPRVFPDVAAPGEQLPGELA